MAAGDHEFNDVYLENALYVKPGALLYKNMLPQVSVSMEESGNDFVLVTEDDVEILRFSQNGAFADNLRRKGAIMRIHELWKEWEAISLPEDDEKGLFVMRTIGYFREIMEIANDFDDMNLGSILKEME